MKNIEITYQPFIGGYANIVDNKIIIGADSDQPIRKRAVIKGEWDTEMGKFISENNVRALSLNYTKGWVGQDYNFLRELHQLEELEIIAPDIVDLSSVEELVSLRNISINSSPKLPIDFSKLKLLERCYISWWTGATSVFDCECLTDLYINKLKLKDFFALGRLKNLSVLTLANSNITNLDSIVSLRSLKKLALLNCRDLENLTGIEHLKDMIWLVISGSNRIGDFSRLSSLKNLQVIDLSDCGKIETLKFLQELPEIRAIAFAGGSTTIADGDLTPLATRPKLAMAMFGQRRHYSHKLSKKWSWENFYYPDKILI